MAAGGIRLITEGHRTVYRSDASDGEGVGSEQDARRKGETGISNQQSASRETKELGRQVRRISRVRLIIIITKRKERKAGLFLPAATAGAMARSERRSYGLFPSSFSPPLSFSPSPPSTFLSLSLSTPSVYLLSFPSRSLSSSLLFAYPSICPLFPLSLSLLSFTMGSVAQKPGTFLFTSESVGEGHPDKIACVPLSPSFLIQWPLTSLQRPGLGCHPRCLSRRGPPFEGRRQNVPQSLVLRPLVASDWAGLFPHEIFDGD